MTAASTVSAIGQCEKCEALKTLFDKTAMAHTVDRIRLKTRFTQHREDAGKSLNALSVENALVKMLCWTVDC